MRTSETLSEITKALIEARKNIKVFAKDKKGYSYNYTSLSTIIEGIQPELLENEILLIQSLNRNSPTEYVSITTRLQHSSGEFIEDTYRIPLPPMKGANITQHMGAAITYGKRYAVSAILGLNTDDDPDGITPNERIEEKNTRIQTIPIALKTEISNAKGLAELTKTYNQYKEEYSNSKEWADLIGQKKRLLKIKESRS